MIKYTLYRGYLLKNLGVGMDVEVYRSTYSEVQNMFVETLPSELSAMNRVDAEIADGREGMVTDADINDMNRRIQVEPRYLHHVMGRVRQHLGLHELDTSRDDEINTMSRSSVLDHCLEWEGIIGYGGHIRGWVETIYGTSLTDY